MVCWFQLEILISKMIIDQENLNVIQREIEKNIRLTTKKLSEKIGVLKRSIHNHLVNMGYVSQYDISVPHNLSEKNCMDRFSICDNLLKRHAVTPFLKQIITGDESELCRTMSFEKCLGSTRPILHNEHQRQIFIKKLCFLFGWIIKEWYVMNFCYRTKLSILMSTAANMTI